MSNGRLAACLAALSVAACAGPTPAPAPGAVAPSAASADAGWKPLFDGTSLSGWKVSDFGGHGPVEVKDGVLVLQMGESCTGVTWTGDVPRTDYEIALEARRTEGVDFFCGLTFPVGEGNASLIVGGWGGRLVGLSCIDGNDAANNDTQRMMSFLRGRWYRVRVRVAAGKVEAWIDDEPVVSVETAGHRISVRMDIEECLPLGVASWRTTAEVRNLRMRRVSGS